MATGIPLEGYILPFIAHCSHSARAIGWNCLTSGSHGLMVAEGYDKWCRQDESSEKEHPARFPVPVALINHIWHGQAHVRSSRLLKGEATRYLTGLPLG